MSLCDDRPLVSLSPVLALEAQLPTGGIPRSLSLACTSSVSTPGAGVLGHCEREDHQRLALFYPELYSSIMVQGFDTADLQEAKALLDELV